MPTVLPVEKFLEMSAHFPVGDVRTPAEFRQGHFPGAVNIPLFTDDERALVGTLYKKSSPQKAFDEGLRITGPKMISYVEQARRIARDNTLLLYCWRGGMRSGSMGWLFETAGMTVYLLEGGYKAFRRHVRETFARPARLIVLGGMTGSGKTDILHELKKKGEQVLDLEGRAHHKGSAFGALGQPDQPTTEQFENDLFADWNTLDLQQTIWVEDESRSVGRVFIPEELFRQMRTAPLIAVTLDLRYRIDRLVRDYALFDPEELIAAITRIRKRLGGVNTQKCIEAIRQKDFREATTILLSYYDKSYNHTMSARDEHRIYPLQLNGSDPADHADAILTFARKKELY
jgi:tRNA 2-selenouridine synthase